MKMTGREYAKWLRTITYRFLTLPHRYRMHIVVGLRLLDDEDEGSQDFELFKRVINRARGRGLTERLERAIKEAVARKTQREKEE